jgi:hypothetical protein
MSCGATPLLLAAPAAAAAVWAALEGQLACGCYYTAFHCPRSSYFFGGGGYVSALSRAGFLLKGHTR